MTDATAKADEPLLDLSDVSIVFDTADGPLVAVDQLRLRLARGQVLGLVGESGSGKSLTGFAIMGALDPPGRVGGGRILFDGEDLTTLDPAALRRLRGNRMAMILQDPMLTLNPTLTIGTQIIEAIRAHRPVGRAEARRLAVAAMRRVGIGDAEKRLDSYPHEYSGGMRQRVSIAIALLHAPDLIIADEPTTALDVTVQAQILLEVRRLVEEMGSAWIWISHDLSVVAGLADRIAVMYAGRIVEEGPARTVLTRPRHPYTQGLLRSAPDNPPLADGRLWQIAGSAPAIAHRVSGCRFRPRCPRADAACAEPPPDSGTTHRFACWHPHDGEAVR